MEPSRPSELYARTNVGVHRRGHLTEVTSAPAARTGAADASAFLDELDGRLNGVLADLTRVWTTEIDDDGPLDVLGPIDLPDLLRDLLESGGKRIRPTMCHLGWLSTRRDDEGRSDVVTVGAALELLHVFALVHDDVMDESPSRRGRPSVHARASQLHVDDDALGSAGRFGESIAVLVGDLAHAEADHLAADLAPELRAIWRVLVVELVCGQRRDITGSAAGRRDVAHARQVARMKSGAYTVERPLQLGAAAAGAPEPLRRRLHTYGRAIGEAFALRDDLLGVWGDPAVTGKPAGDDLISGKPTVILALAEERLTGPSRALLDRVGTPDLTIDDVADLQAGLERCGVVASVEEMIGTQVQVGLTALDGAQLEPAGVDGLARIAHQIAWRDR